MDKLYDKLFDLTDDSDNHYHKLIPTIDVQIFQLLLEKDIEIINKSKMNLSEWTKFKWQLIKYEKECELPIFDWKINSNAINGIYPFIHLNINYDILEKIPSRYFQVHMAIENIWMNDESLENVWQYIDPTN